MMSYISVYVAVSLLQYVCVLQKKIFIICSSVFERERLHLFSNQARKDMGEQRKC